MVDEAPARRRAFGGHWHEQLLDGTRLRIYGHPHLGGIHERRRQHLGQLLLFLGLIRMPNEDLAVRAPTVIAHPHVEHQWQPSRPRWRRRLGRRQHQATKQHDDLLVVQLLRPVERSLAVGVFHKRIGALGEQSLHHVRFVVPSSIV